MLHRHKEVRWAQRSLQATNSWCTLMKTASYLIPAAPALFEETIKKSRFITLLAHTPGREAARAFVQSVKAEHPGARHHCWAFIAGAPDNAQQWGFSDDGEPSGTAGRPILARLEGSGLGEICAVVVRYYGGIRLGTGGLVRAYSGGVGSALPLISTVLKVPQTSFSFSCEYDQLTDVQHIVGAHSGVVTDTVYGINLQLTVTLPSGSQAALREHLGNHFKGRLVLPKSPP